MARLVPPAANSGNPGSLRPASDRIATELRRSGDGSQKQGSDESPAVAGAENSVSLEVIVTRMIASQTLDRYR